VYAIDKLIAQTRRLASEYRRATGKTLPVSGEIAIHDAIRLLGLDAAPAGTAGYDAVRAGADGRVRIQVKARVIFDDSKGGQRLGQLRADQPWDMVALVLMNAEYETTAIYEADRAAILAALEGAAGAARGRRGALSVARFKMIGRRIWALETGPDDDGYWTHPGTT
jgi:hypothetical protein